MFNLIDRPIVNDANLKKSYFLALADKFVANKKDFEEQPQIQIDIQEQEYLE